MIGSGTGDTVRIQVTAGKQRRMAVDIAVEKQFQFLHHLRIRIGCRYIIHDFAKSQDTAFFLHERDEIDSGQFGTAVFKRGSRHTAREHKKNLQREIGRLPVDCLETNRSGNIRNFMRVGNDRCRSLGKDDLGE